MRVEVKTYVDINIGDVVRYDNNTQNIFSIIGYVTHVGRENSNILWSDGTTIEWSNTVIANRLTGDNKYDILKQLLVSAETGD